MQVMSMQVTQKADKHIKAQVGLSEEVINFHPSPNFKNMKKFLKSRSELERTSPIEKVQAAPEIQQNVIERKEEMKTKLADVVPTQPPLPPYPPPPDSPIIIIIKEEKPDESETTFNDTNPELLQQPSSERQKKPKPRMCKEYVRGNCKRPICKFTHEIDLTQLRGVFTFCWNYQNDVCAFPHCRYVHADIFEEAEFYRTGYLPPHARSHQKNYKPGPVEEAKQAAQPAPVANNMYPSDAPAAPAIQGEELAPLIACIPTSNMVEEPRVAGSSTTSPQTREWPNVDQFARNARRSPRELELEQNAKVCKNCEMMEYREQYNKDKLHTLAQSIVDIDQKKSLVDKQKDLLFSIILTLQKPSAANNRGINMLMKILLDTDDQAKSTDDIRKT